MFSEHSRLREVKGQCPESQPVLAISMDVSLKESRSFAALWMPMLIRLSVLCVDSLTARAATKGVGTIMQVPSEAGGRAWPAELKIYTQYIIIELSTKTMTPFYFQHPHPGIRCMLLAPFWTQDVSVRLAHPVEKRMLSLEDAADLSGKGSKFKIVTEAFKQKK